MKKLELDDVDAQEPVPLYATCSHCGQQLGQYFPPCWKHTTTCPKCGSRLAIAAKEGRLMIDIISTREQRLHSAAAVR